MAQQYKVQNNSKLLDFLFLTLDGWSKKTVKQRLQGSGIFVNDCIQTKHNFMLQSGDVVSIGGKQQTINNNPDKAIKLDIIYQDQYIIAINKPAGLLSVGNNSENKQHALAILRTQLTRGKDRVGLWPVHRLDRDTTGILLFVTSRESRGIPSTIAK